MLALPVMTLAKLYGAFLPEPCPEMDRGALGFKVLTMVCIPLATPLVLVMISSLVVDFIAMNSFGLIYALFSGRLFSGSVAKSWSVIGPYQGGPSLLAHLPDILVCFVGMLQRQGLIAFALLFGMMCSINPWVKYWIVVNPWLQDLEERLITQISTRMDDMPMPVVSATFRHQVSCLKQGKRLRNRISELMFCPHYPYPPPDRRWALGMQKAKAVVTIVHSTHFQSGSSTDEHGYALPGRGGAPFPTAGEFENQIISNSMTDPAVGYRVILWHNNPYHIYTGWVEAGVTTGEPNQPNKNRGLEHPM